MKGTPISFTGRECLRVREESIEGKFLTENDGLSKWKRAELNWKGGKELVLEVVPLSHHED